jgi:L-asparaginase
MPHEGQRPHLSYITLGGTIACVGEPGAGALVTLNGSDLLASLPGIQDLAEVDVLSLRQVPSGDLTMSDILELADQIRRSIRNGVSGVVISQGTDTLEETSYLLDLLIEEDLAIVLTGAMRNPSLPGTDGSANLLAALQVAASGITAGLGAVVVFNDEIHAARFVRKRHTSSTATFGSPLTGPVGYITEGKPRLLVRPLGRILVRLPDKARSARVGLAVIGFDEDEDLLRSVASGLDGLVIAAFGGGHVPARVSPVLEDINRQIPVVLASRTFSGPMLTKTYAYGGSEVDLLSRGLISSGAVDAPHARILLRLLLMSGATRPTIAESFQEALSHEGTLVITADGPVSG